MQTTNPGTGKQENSIESEPRARRQNLADRIRNRHPWGTDDQYGGLPVIEEPAGRATASAARFALFFTGIAWLVYIIEQSVRVVRVDLTPLSFAETTVYFIFVTLLTASAAAYLLARVGYFARIKDHRRVPRSAIDDYFEQTQPALTVLVPSYREEKRIVRLTLLSAALQEYADLRVVLLIDDPPHPADPDNQQLLEQARQLIPALTDELEEPRRVFEQALASFEQEKTTDEAAMERLAGYYDAAAEWFEQEYGQFAPADHIDTFYMIEILQRNAQDLRTTAQAVRLVAREPDRNISRRRMHQLYTRLQHIFQAEFSSFERKQFASLSHEPNKAMNLNSYIGLMGGSYNSATSPAGRILVPANGRTADLTVPNCDYILTLDADSMLLPEYCLRLVYLMEQPEHDDVAIAQTPYSAYRGTRSRIERIAGATTDIQHIVHLGMTKYGATSWVGANAVIRKPALNDIEKTTVESGFVIHRYISDRTVIEDTESTIDLRAQGWQLYNYPERLSYSATPPDFGSLTIQRQRWANGGLIILPELWQLFGRPQEGTSRITPSELFLRTNYLASISWSSVSLLLLLFYPFDGFLLSQFVVLTAVPYWWMMATDLNRVGYRRRDIFQIYGFNLLLLPVNLAGTIQSIVQAIGGQRPVFARTPKIKGHTVAPLLYVILPFVLVIWSAWTLQHDISNQTYIHGAFAALNLAAISFALIAFLGIKNIIIDVFMNIYDFVYPTVEPQTGAAEAADWASVLYVGSSLPGEIKSSAPLAAALATQDLMVNASEPENPHPASIPAEQVSPENNGAPQISNDPHFAQLETDLASAGG